MFMCTVSHISDSLRLTVTRRTHYSRSNVHLAADAWCACTCVNDNLQVTELCMLPACCHRQFVHFVERSSSKSQLGLQLAFEIYDQLKRSGLELTLHSFHTALKGSSHLRAEGLQELYAHMHRQDLVLKDKTFSYVFRAAASCGGGVSASWIIQV